MEREYNQLILISIILTDREKMEKMTSLQRHLLNFQNNPFPFLVYLPWFFLPFSFQFGIISPEFGNHNSNTHIAWVGFWFISNFVYPNLKESEGPSDSFHGDLLLRTPSHLTIVLSCPGTRALLYMFPFPLETILV